MYTWSNRRGSSLTLCPSSICRGLERKGALIRSGVACHRGRSARTTSISSCRIDVVLNGCEVVGDRFRDAIVEIRLPAALRLTGHTNAEKPGNGSLAGILQRVLLRCFVWLTNVVGAAKPVIV